MILLRARRILLPLLAVGVGWISTVQPPDLYRFGQLGGQLLAGHIATVYADAWNQAGPLQLLLARLLLLGGTDGNPSRALTMAIDVALVLGAMLLCATPETELLAGGTVVLWLGLQQPWTGHPVELLIGVGWVFALREVRAGRWPWAAVALAGTVAIAPWGILGFPALLAVAGLRASMKTAAVAVGLSLLVYLPFVGSGHFAMFSHSWPVYDGSLVHWIAPSMHQARWPVRFVQAVVTGGGCAWAAYRSRGGRLALVAGPMAAAVLRIVTDPVSLNYYWLTVAVIGVLTVVAVGRPESRSRWVMLLVFCYTPWAVAAGAWRLGGQQFIAALTCAAVLAVVLPRTTGRPQPVRDDAEYGVPAYAG